MKIGGVRSVGALHEPEGRVRQSPARRLCIAKLRRARSDAPYRYKVPMHGTKAVGALHELVRRTPVRRSDLPTPPSPRLPVSEYPGRWARSIEDCVPVTTGIPWSGSRGAIA